MNSLTEVLLLLSFVIALFYAWIRHTYSYWKRKNIATIAPFPVLGNLKDFIVRKRNGSEHFAYLYNHPQAQDQPVVGLHIFLTPHLMIRDLDLIKQILVKDFNKFPDRFASTDPVRDGLGWHNLFMIKNPKWRDLRSKLSLFFGKLRIMYPLIHEVGDHLDAFLLSLNEEQSIQNVRELSSAYTTDVIATVAFGVQANSLKYPNAAFRRHGRMITTFRPSRALEIVSIMFIPKLVTLLRSKQFSKVTSQFFRTTITHVLNQREISGAVRNDLIDILLSFKKSKDYDGNTDFLVAQAALFFSAGFHTSASAMTFTLYELSKNQTIQHRLRQEIKEALLSNDGHVTYEVLAEMQYLDMVLDETLRMYPPLPYLDRQCVLPKGETEYSLKPLSDFAIPHGMPVSVPFFAIQRDPKYFPDPLTYDPERFSPENKKNILPFTYMPFGDGPRSCIGQRLAKIQTKIGLLSILKNHYVTTCEQTPLEMVLDNAAFITQEKGPLLLKLVKDSLHHSTDIVL